MNTASPTGGAAAIITIQTAGPQGPIGSSWLKGTTAPESELGSVGDYYLNTSNGDIYGPKTQAGWGQPIFNISGSSGGTDLSYDAVTRLLSSSTGNDVTLPLATTSDAGLLSSTD